MGSPEKLAQYNTTTKLWLQSLSHVLTTPLRRPWPKTRPIQPLRGSGVHQSDSTSGSLRRTRAGARRSVRKSLEGLCGRGIAPVRPCTFFCSFPGKLAAMVQECSVWGAQGIVGELMSSRVQWCDSDRADMLCLCFKKEWTAPSAVQEHPQEPDFICKHCGFPTQAWFAKNWYNCQELVTDGYQASIESPLPLASTVRRRWHGRSLASRCSSYGEIWPGGSLGVQGGPSIAQRSVLTIQRWTAGVDPWPFPSRPCIEAFNSFSSLATRWGYISDPARLHDGESLRTPPPSAGTHPGLRAPLVACACTGRWEASGASVTRAWILLSAYKI